MIYTNRLKSTALLFSLVLILSFLSITYGTVKKHCPLAEKCPYYDAVSSGKNLPDFDWTKSNCPAAGKCPYFEDIKKRALANGDHDALPSKEGGCPYAEGCPHAQNNNKHTGDGDISKCPFMNNNEKCPYLKNESSEDRDLTKKCPHFQKLKLDEKVHKDEL